MFGGFIGFLAGILSLFVFFIGAVLVGQHPWTLLILVPLLAVLLRTMWRKFDRVTKGKPMDVAKLYPPGFDLPERFKTPKPNNEHFIEPITPSGHNRGTHG